MDTWSIASVERDTGLSKELLRMWERRYGFPQPLRDGQGDRLYPQEQVERLRLLKRLLDAGHRPGKLLALDDAQLSALAQAGASGASALPPTADDALLLQQFMDIMISNDVPALRQFLQEQLEQRGLQRFVLEVVVHAVREVGVGWYDGRLAVHQEHLFSEELQKLLRQRIYALPDVYEPPRVLLTTVPNELHGLGLLMVEAILRQEGADVRSFGLQMPVSDIAAAAVRHGVDVVGLSFSSSFPSVILRQVLHELDQVLAPPVEIWAGGAGVRGMRKLPARVRRLDQLQDIAGTVQHWRRQHGRAASSPAT